MKAFTPDKKWAVTVYAGTPMALRFIIEPGEDGEVGARTRYYAFQDEAVAALVIKGFDEGVASRVIEDAIEIFKTERDLGVGAEA